MVELKLIDKETKKNVLSDIAFEMKHFFALLLFCFIMVAVYVVFIPRYMWEFSTILILAGIALWRVTRKREEAVGVGVIRIDYQFIEICHNDNRVVAKVADVNNMKILSDYYAGYTFNDRNDFTGLFKIEMVGKEILPLHFHAIIENQEDFDDLSKIIRYWYENNKNVSIKEYDINEASRKILLRGIPPYEELQVLKKQLGIESIYS